MNLLRASLVSLLFVFLLPVQSLQAAPSLEDYGALETTSEVAISPNGKFIAFRKHDSNMDIVAVVSVETGAFLQGMNVAGLKLRDLYFFDDSKVIVVAAENKRVRGYKGDIDLSTAFLFNIESGDVEQLLTPGDVIYKGQSGLGRIVGVSKTGSHVFMPAYVPKSSTDQSPNYSLVSVEVAAPKRPKVIEKGTRYTEDYFLDAEGNLLAEEQMNGLAGYHAVVAHNGEEEREIFREETGSPNIAIVGLTPDFSKLVTSVSVDGRTSFRTMSLADGSFSEVLFARKDADVSSPLRDINQVVHGVTYSGFYPSYEFFDPELNQRMNTILEDFPEHSVWLESWSPDWKHLVVRVEGSGSSGDYLLYTEGQPRRFITSARPNISAEDVNPIAEFSYQARDGLIIPTLLTIPRSRIESISNLPAIMLPHGGPHAHDWLGFDWLAQALASQGYLIIQPQFRGSTGFGTAHWSAGRGEWGKKMQDDLTDGLEALARAKVIDPERVCIAGWSYGGYAALAGAAFEPTRYKCAISINGISDIPSLISQEKSLYGRNHWIVDYLQNTITAGEADKKAYEAISPANFADQFQAPVLLIHGEDDIVVNYDQAKLMHKQLKKAKKQVYLVKLKNEDHYLSFSETRMSTLNAIVGFVNQHLGEKVAN